MGHPRETNLPHDMGLPRPELAGGRETGREMGRGIYRRRLGSWNWQVGRREEEFTTGDGTSKAGNWQVGRREEEFNRRRWDIQGRRIYHMTWDFQGRNWQVGRQEEEFTAGGGASKVGIWQVGRWGRRIYHSRPELAGRETGRGILPQEMGAGNWQVGRREEEFTT